MKIASLSLPISKKEFLKIIKHFDSDPKTEVLFKNFLNLVHNKFTEEEFETKRKKDDALVEEIIRDGIRVI